MECMQMGILFNHESPRKDTSFVLRKISSSVAQIKYGLKKKIKLGDIKSGERLGARKRFCESHVVNLSTKNQMIL